VAHRHYPPQLAGKDRAAAATGRRALTSGTGSPA
jgi:hypothetical protein